MRRMAPAALGLLLFVSCSADRGSGTSDVEPRVTEAEVPTSTPDGGSPEPGTPPAGDDFSFAVIGDFGARTIDQLNVAARMCEWHESHPFDIVLTTGDNVYPDGAPEWFDASFFAPYKCLFDEGVQWHASLGNHDWMTDEGQPQLDEPAFGMEGENYVVRQSGVRFVIANSNDLDRAWLKKNLEPSKGDRWTVVAFHHPVYSPGLHGSTESLSDLPVLFEKAGVDLVLNGHDHLYSVTKPLNGIRYVVTGGGGAELYPCLLTEESDVCELEHHFLYVTVDRSSIHVRAIPDSGRPFHEFTTTGVD